MSPAGTALHEAQLRELAARRLQNLKRTLAQSLAAAEASMNMAKLHVEAIREMRERALGLELTRPGEGSDQLLADPEYCRAAANVWEPVCAALQALRLAVRSIDDAS